jgi:hypothetical protein
MLATGCDRDTLPRHLSDREFWDLVETLSEPPSTFPLSDNLVSNERAVVELARSLRPAGGVYIGVGPEQNFTYIAAEAPALAFIVDIRRENRNLHLLYKALFEISDDRLAFASHLFSRPRPAAVNGADVDDIFRSLDHVPPSSAVYAETFKLVRDQLLLTHRLPLSTADMEEIGRLLEAFLTAGPDIDFWYGRPAKREAPSYRELMTARDRNHLARSFLATREAFTRVRDLHNRNLIVPVVGDFGGTSALRGIGQYVRHHSAFVRLFYASNVAVYLTNRKMAAFCENLERLPIAASTLFLDGARTRRMSSTLTTCRTRRYESLVYELPK